jgi:hypothetical protein
MYFGVGPVAAANNFEFCCLDLRSPRMFFNKLPKKQNKNLAHEDLGESETGSKPKN